MPVVSDEHRAEVRARIVAAAADVIRRDGVDGATTRAIQQAAGVSTGTIYNYFASAAELIVAAGEEVTRQDWAEILDSLDVDGRDGGLRRLVRDVVIDATDFPKERVAAVRLRMGGDPGTDAAAAAGSYNRFLVETIAPILHDERDRARLRADLDLEALIELLDMVRDGIVIRAAQDSFATDHDRVGALLLAVLEAGVFAEPPNRTD